MKRRFLYNSQLFLFRLVIARKVFLCQADQRPERQKAQPVVFFRVGKRMQEIRTQKVFPDLLDPCTNRLVEFRLISQMDTPFIIGCLYFINN